MKTIILSLLISLILCIAAARETVVLEPVPRYVWDESLQKRDDPVHPANVTLTDHESLVWITPNKTNHSTIVSMVTWTKQDELIIDMAKFAWQLKAVNCTENMSLQFYHNISFKAAMKEWEWVNFNGLRSFVMIGDHIKCGRNWSLDPWVVSNARYDTTNLIIHLDAKKRTWKEVTRRYNVDFGQIDRRGPKRDIDFEYSKAFTIPLDKKFPSKIISEKFGQVKFDVNCVDCGTSGGLVFAGHVEGTPPLPFIGGGIDVLTLSVTPDSIQANIGLEISFSGSYNFSGKDFAKKTYEVAEIPLPYSFSIPGVFEFGPSAKVIAGYELESISGVASISTGLTATIPQDSIAKVEIFGKRSLEMRGWIPTFQTQPLTIEADVTAKGELFAGIAVSVGLEVLRDTSINLDLNLKFPELNIEATAGYNSAGFCPNNNNPFGVKLEVSLGAELDLVAWKELNGKQDILFDVDLYSNEEIYKFPEVCLSFGGDGGACTSEPNEDDVIEDDDDFTKRSLSLPREAFSANTSFLAASEKTRQYNMKCDTNKAYTMSLKEHPPPSKIKSTSVPYLNTGYTCGQKKVQDCPVVDWRVFQETDYSYIQGIAFASEHVYEGVWVRNFLDELHDNHFEDVDDKCNKIGTLLGVKAGTLGLTDDLLNSIGNNANFLKTMTIFRSTENNMKARFFNTVGNPAPDGPAIDRKLNEKTWALEEGVCRLGHVLNVCKYMSHELTRVQLKNTLDSFDAAFDKFDQRSKEPGEPKSYKDVHRAWFKAMYEKGFDKGRKEIKRYATGLQGKTGYANLPPEFIALVDSLVTDAGVAAECKNEFKYPWE